MINLGATYGENIINQIRVKAYPKKIDTSATVLFSLDSPILVPSSSIKKFTGSFKDGSTSINGTGMINPVATTDYIANTKADGTGTNITASIIITAEYSSQSVEYTITNNSVYQAFITKLTARGYGITSYNPIDAVLEFDASIGAYGYQSMDVEQKYQSDITTGVVASEAFLANNKDPQTVLDKIYLLANKSDDLMYAYLSLDVGSKVWITETQTEIDNHYYIQSVDFDISIGGIIQYSWKVVELLSLEKGLKPAEIHFEFESKQAVDFGYLPKISNLMQRSYSCWINSDSIITTDPRVAMGIKSDNSGTVLLPISRGRFQVYAHGGPGIWNTTNEDLWIPEAWCFVVMTRDLIADPLAIPLIFVNGISQPTTQANPPSTYRDETGAFFVLGNVKTITVNYSWPLGGWLKDARIYNRILSSEEIVSLYGGTNLTDGLVFQSPCFRERYFDLYDNQNLSEDKKLIENVYGFIGTPKNSPLCKGG